MYIKVATFKVSVATFVDFEQHFSNLLALKRATFQDFMSTICQGLAVKLGRIFLLKQIRASRTANLTEYIDLLND